MSLFPAKSPFTNNLNEGPKSQSFPSLFKSDSEKVPYVFEAKKEEESNPFKGFRIAQTQNAGNPFFNNTPPQTTTMPKSQGGFLQSAPQMPSTQSSCLFGSSQPQSKWSKFPNPQPPSLFYKEIAEPQTKANESIPLFPPAQNIFIVSAEESKIPFSKDKSPSKNKLSCIICYEKFNTTKIIPKVLLCGHSLCSLCLNRMHALKNPVVCPLCSSQDNRLAIHIPINFAVFEICEENKTIDICKEHNREIGLFCKTDHSLLCFDCVVHHSAHEMLLLSDGYVEEVINKKKDEIKEVEERIKEKIEICEKNFKILEGDKNKIQDLVDNHKKEYEIAQNQLIEILKRSSEALRQNLSDKYSSIFERNQKSMENYKNFTADFKKKKEELERVAKDFNSMTIADKINCEVLMLDEVMEFPEIENVEDIVKSLEDPINYKGETLEKFNENINT